MIRIWISFMLLSLIRAQNYVEDYSLSYTWGKQVPQSCTCKQTGATPATCSYFVCSCTCDLQAGICDYGCCCDPDCSPDQIKRFTTLGCKYEGTGSSSIQYCYSSDQLAKVNPRDPLGGQSAAETALGEALCVQKINYALEGQYYSDVKSGAFVDSSYGYDETSKIAAVSPDAYYDQGDVINVFHGNNSDIYVIGAGLLAIPTPDNSGLCNDFSYAQFEVNQLDGSTACLRQVPADATSFASMCANKLSTTLTATNMSVAKHANSYALLGAGVSSDTVRVSLRQVTYRDFTTGADYDITAAWTNGNCATTLYTSNVAYVSSTCKYVSSTSSAALICAGAILYTAYTVTHSSDAYSTISKVEVDLIVSDIPQPATASLVQTQTTIQYATDASSSVSQANGNQVRRKKSGNPGYLPGSPVLFGTSRSVSAGNVIDEQVKGLSVPSSLLPTAYATGLNGVPDSCPLDPAVSGLSLSQSLGSQTLGFGNDLVTGCTLSLNRAQLMALCCEGQANCNPSITSADSPYAYGNGVPVFFNASSGYVGIYGNADPLDASQWLALAAPVIPVTGLNRKWNDFTGTCSNMITSLNYKFLVAYSGELSNPQSKLIAASAAYSTVDWVLALPPNDFVSTQSFPLTVTVSFVKNDQQGVEEYYPPPPPVLFSVPYDVFYPFINDAPRVTSVSVSVSIILSLVVFAGLLFQS